MLIDSHCHLNHKRLLNIGTPDDVIKNAKDNNIAGCLTICCRIAQEKDELLSLVDTHESIWCTIGTHPHDADDTDEVGYDVDDLCALATSHDKIVGIGESGLDYFYKNSSVDGQKASFRKHIRACIETNMPLVVHAREADDDIIAIIKEEDPEQKLRGVMHCFSSGAEMGLKALDHGFYISFSGIVTFPKSLELQNFAHKVPKDRILVETDAPYLAPVPYRGKINQPAYVADTASFLAGHLSMSLEELSKVTTDNFFSLFDRAKLKRENTTQATKNKAGDS